MREYVKFDDQPSTVDGVAESFLKAYRIAMTEPKGPVYICLDSDVQEAKIDKPMVVPHAQFFRPPPGPGPNPESLRNASRLLAEAQWPVIVAGELGRNPKACRRCWTWPKRWARRSSTPTAATLFRARIR